MGARPVPGVSGGHMPLDAHGPARRGVKCPCGTEADDSLALIVHLLVDHSAQRRRQRRRAAICLLVAVLILLAAATITLALLNLNHGKPPWAVLVAATAMALGVVSSVYFLVRDLIAALRRRR